MNITIEFYGRLKAVFGGPSEQLVWSQPQTTIQDLYQHLCQQHQVNDDTTGIRPIINDTFTDWHQPIQDQDVVGFFPPAAGG